MHHYQVVLKDKSFSVFISEIHLYEDRYYKELLLMYKPLLQLIPDIDYSKHNGRVGVSYQLQVFRKFL